MAENKIDPELERINTEHTKACYEAGVIQYKILLLEDDLKTKNAHIRRLNHEGAKILKEQAAPRNPEPLAEAPQ